MSLGHFLNLFEKVQLDDAELYRLYAKWNQALFEGALPDIQIKWALLKQVGGRTQFLVEPDPSKPRVDPIMVRLGYAKRHDGHTLNPSTLKIQISSVFQRSPQQLDEIMIHEMIHVWMAAIKHLYDEQHGPNFMGKAREIETKVGFPIPLTDDVKGLVLRDNKLRTVCVKVSSIRHGQFGFAIYSQEAILSALKSGDLQERVQLLKQTCFIYSVTSPVWTQKSFVYTVSRSALTPGLYPISLDDPAIKELQSARLLFKAVRGEIEYAHQTFA